MTNSSIENPFKNWVDLVQPRIGGKVVYATDDFFAAKERMIDPGDPVFIPDKFDDNGKWMDGWESRRKRGVGYDFSIIKLGVQGIIHGVDIDTTHFTGNYPPSASIDACVSEKELPGDDVDWTEIQPACKLSGNSHHYLTIHNRQSFTHLRLNIYPDGGIARLRVYGEVTPDWDSYGSDEPVDLLALENGGRALVCNDQHFGSMHNLNAPGRGVNMGDGWETARRREPGNDWAILCLGRPGVVEKVEIDTAHFKGNCPDRASIQAALVTGGSPDVIATQSLFWETLLPEVKLDIDKQHYFESELQKIGSVSHVRLNIIPDGGVSRLRLYGHVASTE